MPEKLRVILTSCGGLVIPGMVECLRAEPDYDFHVVGVDMLPDAVGASFVDSFHTVPGGLERDYADAMLDIARREKADVIVPLSDEEAFGLCRHKERFAEIGTAIVCSAPDVVETAIDKARMLTFLRESGVAVPKFFEPSSLDEVDQAVEKLGYPENEVVLKPTRGRGGRGFWILSEKVNGQDLLLKSRGLQRLPYSIVRSLLEQRDELPPVVVMQYLAGRDFNVDVLALDGEMLYCMPIERIVPDAGPVQVGRIVHEIAIDGMCREAVSAFGFSHNINIELAYPEASGGGPPLIYEINPRVSAPIAAHGKAGINLLLFGILTAMGRSVPRGLEYVDTTMQRCWREVYP